MKPNRSDRARGAGTPPALLGIFRAIVLALPFLLLPAPGSPGAEPTIIDSWAATPVPPAPALQDVTVDPSTTAFLVLDIEERTCNPERRPRCLATVPAISGFLSRAREKGIFVAYSLTRQGTRETILPEVKPKGAEPIVQSSVDKFFRTELEEILSQKGIGTVIIAGTAAEGAVLHTAAAASMRGLRVIVPVDGLSSSSLYAEQYTVWHLLNSPGTRQNAVLTRFDRISF